MAADAGSHDIAGVAGFPTAIADATGNLGPALDAVRRLVVDDYVSATPLVNPLLDLWAVAVQIDAQVAMPVEIMLTTLIGRHLVSAAEVWEMCDAVEAALKLQVVCTSTAG